MNSSSQGIGDVGSSSLRSDSKLYKVIQRHKLELFATGRASARWWLTGPDLAAAEPRWHPHLAGRAVSIQARDERPRGYVTRPEAIAAAQEFRRRCRLALTDGSEATKNPRSSDPGMNKESVSP